MDRAARVWIELKICVGLIDCYLLVLFYYEGFGA